MPFATIPQAIHSRLANTVNLGTLHSEFVYDDRHTDFIGYHMPVCAGL